MGIRTISAAPLNMKNLNGESYFLACKRLYKSSGWKYVSQKFLLNRLSNISKLKEEVDKGRYVPSQGPRFKIRENGHERIINSMTPKDAVVQHALADDVLIPELSHYLIHDNGASLKHKGISFTRRRFEEHLRWHYRRYGTEGYVLMIDFRKYFDNIRHDIAIRQIEDKLDDQMIISLVRSILQTYEIDVSYTDDPNIEDEVFNSLDYQSIPDRLKTGRRMLRKSIGIGSQISQIIGIYYPNKIDTWCKTVRSIHCYDAYMDDRIIIHPNKEFLKMVLSEIEVLAKERGIFINHKKTQIVKISHGFTWLKTRYLLTSTGKIIKRIPRDVITRERRRLKKLSKLVASGIISEEYLKNQYLSWRGDKKNYQSVISIRNLDKLYRRLEYERHRNKNQDRNAEK